MRSTVALCAFAVMTTVATWSPATASAQVIELTPFIGGFSPVGDFVDEDDFLGNTRQRSPPAFDSPIAVRAGSDGTPGAQVGAWLEEREGVIEAVADEYAAWFRLEDTLPVWILDDRIRTGDTGGPTPGARPPPLPPAPMSWVTTPASTESISDSSTIPIWTGSTSRRGR